MSKHNILNVLLLVLIRHLDVPPIRFQIDRDGLAEPLVIRRKSQLQDASDVIFPWKVSICVIMLMKRASVQSPRKVSMEVCIYTFHIRQGDPLPQDHFVESTNKEGIQETPVEDGQSDNSTNEFKVD